jgi:predicted MFS family arabinose efflux permease
LTFIGALVLVMFGVNQASGAGWGSARVLVPLVAGTGLLVAFALVVRRSPHPVLDLTLLRNRRFVGWCLAIFVVAAGPTGVVVFLPTYLQGVNGASAQATGLTMLMLTAPVLVMPQIGSRLVNRGLPAWALVTASLTLIAAGNAWLTVLHPGIGALGLLGPLTTIGFGMGLVVGTADAQAMNQVDPDRLGMAAGFLNTVRAGSSTLVVTAFGTGLTSLLRARVGDDAVAARVAAGDLTGPDRIANAAHFTTAWQMALWAVAALCAVVVVAIWALLRSGATAVEPTPTTATPERATTG